MFATISILAVASVGAAMVTGSRVIGLRRLVKHSNKVDVAFTAGVGFVLAGTLTGLATAIVAGLFMALLLSVLRLCYRATDAVKAAAGGIQERRANNPTYVYGDEINMDGAWVYNQAPYV